MSYHRRLTLLMLLDSLIVITAIFAGRVLLEASIDVLTFPLVVSSLSLLLSHHAFAWCYKLYKKAWEYASIGELIAIAKAVTLSVATAAVIQQLIVQDIYYRLLAVTWMLHMLLIGGSRLCWRIYRDARLKPGGEAASPVGDRGVRLSGGERQRIVLARAILKRPRLLILDEATSALDAESEHAILASLDRLRGSMTIIVIAHRLSTIRGADQIVVMERGRVVQCGRFAALAAEYSGAFERMLRQQATGG